MEIKAGNIYLEIDAEKTRLLYENLPPMQRKSSAEVNYISNIFQRWSFRTALEEAGIDAMKPQIFTIDLVNPETQMISYVSFYPFICAQEQQLLLSAEEDEVWNTVLLECGGCEVSIWPCNGHLSFAVQMNLPWLFYPPIAPSRYTNKVCLPSIESLLPIESGI